LLGRAVVPGEGSDAVAVIVFHLAFLPTVRHRPVEHALPIHDIVFLVTFIHRAAGPPLLAFAFFLAHVVVAFVYVFV